MSLDQTLYSNCVVNYWRPFPAAAYLDSRQMGFGVMWPINQEVVWRNSTLPLPNFFFLFRGQFQNISRTRVCVCVSYTLYMTERQRSQGEMMCSASILLLASRAAASLAEFNGLNYGSRLIRLCKHFNCGILLDEEQILLDFSIKENKV